MVCLFVVCRCRGFKQTTWMVKITLKISSSDMIKTEKKNFFSPALLKQIDYLFSRCFQLYPTCVCVTSNTHTTPTRILTFYFSFGPEREKRSTGSRKKFFFFKFIYAQILLSSDILTPPNPPPTSSGYIKSINLV